VVVVVVVVAAVAEAEAEHHPSHHQPLHPRRLLPEVEAAEVGEAVAVVDSARWATQPARVRVEMQRT